MPIDIAVWAALAAALLQGLALLRDQRAEHRQQVDEALLAIYTAANETRAYMRHLHRGNPPDEEREQRLARLWELASIPLRHFSEDLARRCELKGNYWRSPRDWPIGLVNDARIGLEQVFNETQRLLGV